MQNEVPVAVKILHAVLLMSPAARSRFRREVSSASALDHPNSVRLKDHGQAPDGSEYLVMELLTGRTLGALLAECGPLIQTRAIRIVAQILDAMAAAHRLGIVHRDLKPSNVILTETDREHDFVKVCDFGLAKVVDPYPTEEDDGDASGTHATLATGQGDLCGTPEYMAPEQARGEILDGRADLYSIGVILFQAVVGQLPFRGRTPLAVVTMQLSAAPPRPRVLRPDLGIASALENLILRALAKDPRERPSSAEVFRADLLQIERDLLRDRGRTARRTEVDRQSDTLPSPSTGTAAIGPGGSFTRRRAAVLVAALSMGGLTVVAWKGRNAPPPVSSAERSSLSQERPAVQPVPSMGVKAALTATPREARPVPPPTAPPPPSIEAKPESPSPRRARTTGAGRQESTRAAAPSIGREAPANPPTTNAPAPEAPSLVAQPEPPPGPEATVQRAEDLLAEGHIVEACAMGETVVSQSPRLALARGFLGRCYMRGGQPEKARASYRVYLDLAPDAGDAAFVRAIVERKR